MELEHLKDLAFRKKLTKSQLALAVAKAKNKDHDLDLTDLGVGTTTLLRAKKVLNRGVPSLVKAVEDGRMSVRAAYDLLVATPFDQVKAAEAATKADYRGRYIEKTVPTPRHILKNGIMYEALRYADMAIAQLDRIILEDPNREAARSKLLGWIEKNLS